jgi:hypothetical protein
MQNHKKYEKYKAIQLLQVNNSAVMDLNDSEVDEIANS